MCGVVTGTSAATTSYIGAYYEWVSPGTAVKYYYLGGKRVAMRDANLYFLLGDHLGSTSITTDANGNKTGELRYAAWGEMRDESGTTLTKRRYTGQAEEASIGLYLMGARWYDPSLARWASPDTVVPKASDPQALNRYAYVGNRPLNYSDPNGHDPSDEDCPYVLTPEQLELIQTVAAEFGIPPELLAAVLNTERVYDTEWYDGAQNFLQQCLLITTLGGTPEVRGYSAGAMVAWEILWKPGAEGVGPGLGFGHVHTGPARELEAYFEARDLANLLPKTNSSVELWQTLLSEEGNVRYVAAYVRRLVDIRQGGDQQGGQISRVGSMSLSDAEIVMDGYWRGVATRYGTGGYAEEGFRTAVTSQHSNGLLVDCSYTYYQRYFAEGD